MRAAELADTTSSAAVQITPARVPFHGGVRAAPFPRGHPGGAKARFGSPGTRMSGFGKYPAAT